MALSHTPREGGAGRKLLTPPSRLPAYVAVVSTVGALGVAASMLGTDWAVTWVEIRPFVLPLIFLAVAAIAGEVKPLIITTRREQRSLSISAPFLLALIVIAGGAIAVVVQMIASLADDIRSKSSPTKSLFNTAQYAVSVLVGRVVYASVAGVPILGGPAEVGARSTLAMVAAGIALIVVNWLLVAGVIALASGQSMGAVLKADLRDFLVTNVVLLSVGGIAALVARDGVPGLLLLAAPVVAAHLFAAAAAKHLHSATHDSLTGLFNRGQLYEDLEHALQEVAKEGGEGPGLVLLDLDHFKDVNDTLGHPVGDQILRDVAERLTAASPEGSFVYRLGGDEYAVLVPGDLTSARQAARDLLGSLDAAIPVETLELLVRASVGVAVAPQHGKDAETLLKNADIALYKAKLERDRISVYSPAFDVNTLERLRLLSDLRVALDSRQLSVVYQPQVDLADGRTVGVEALVRWSHPERGNVRPDEFIPLAENSGLIFPLTAFVLDTALAQAAAWRADGHDLRMAINLSARHLSDLGLPDQVSDAAERHGVPLSAIVLEVTETSILADPSRADVVIRILRSRGVEVSIDDYGTGNASLSYLKRLEIDELKIDRSFVGNMARDDHDLIIVRSTIALALALGLRVVAEGIEDGPTTGTLRTMGEVIGQGYHLGRPAGAADVTKRLEAERKNAAATVPAKASARKSGDA